MKVSEVISMLEEIMDLDEETLSTDTVLDDVEEWDSLSKLTLMATVKKNYQKNLTAAQVKAFETVQDICSYLEAE